MTESVSVASVVVPVPLRQSFDFLLAEDLFEGKQTPVVGSRVLVPFGARKLVGIVRQLKATSDYPLDKLKTVEQVLDTQAVFDQHLWHLIDWLSRYYLAPIGEVVDGAMPSALRKGKELVPAGQRSWRLTEYGRSAALEELSRAPLQRAIIKRFSNSTFLTAEDFKATSSGWRAAIKSLLDKGWLCEQLEVPRVVELPMAQGEQIDLNAEQKLAAEQLVHDVSAHKFSCSLLHGVTGSGKTEVYFAAMRQAIADGQQVLLLVPEIGLTPQLVERVGQQLNVPITAMHSGLNDTERHLAWWHARSGEAKVVIGTRSAVFAPFTDLGLIVVDEEHDSSFKQQDGVRYQARDVAIYRAKQLDIPIVLGSATPSLESLSNAQSGRYRSLRLDHRATSVAMPQIALIDLNTQPSSDGLSPAMLQGIRETLDKGKQVMLFLNRRGFAPVLYCADCQATVKCHRCDSHLTLHQRINRMRCHHCGYEGRAASQCGSCQSDKLVEVGEGTQRVEDALTLRFPKANILRIDRDSTRRKGELAALLEQTRAGEVDILVGTQLLSKGHDFPNVSMVGVLNADQGLFSTDFRASESLFQQILQVAGRAGRRDTVGRVYIQTSFPTHDFFQLIVQHDFDGFAQALLVEREASEYPPFGYFALLRAESTHQARALQFLRAAHSALQPATGVRLMDPVPAPMERRAGKYRAQLLLGAKQRSALNSTLVLWLNHLTNDAAARKLASSVRWSLDIDPIDHY